MRFMSVIMADKNSEAGQPPDPKLMEAMTKLTEEMTKAGVLISTGGLAPTSQGTRVRASGGKLTIIDGPFVESTELLGGYAIVDVRSKEEAVELAKRFMKIHQEILGPTWEGLCEIRQLFTGEEPNPNCG